MGDGVMNGFGCGFEEIGETDVEASFAQTDGGVERGEAAEADVERRDGRAGTEFAVFVFEDGDEGGWCRDFFGARSPRSGIRFGRECCGGLVVEENRGRCGGRRKELQELAQGRWAGMLRGSQGLVLYGFDDFIIRPDSTLQFSSTPIFYGEVQLLVRCCISVTGQRGTSWAGVFCGSLPGGWAANQVFWSSTRWVASSRRSRMASRASLRETSYAAFSGGCLMLEDQRSVASRSLGSALRMSRWLGP